MICKTCRKKTNLVLEFRVWAEKTPEDKRTKDNCAFLELGNICLECLNALDAELENPDNELVKPNILKQFIVIAEERLGTKISPKYKLVAKAYSDA